MEKKYLVILKRILVWAMNVVVDYTKELAVILAFIPTAHVKKFMFYEGIGLGDKIYVYLLLGILVLPISYGVSFLLLQIPRLIFYIILKMTGKRKQKTYETDDSFWEKYTDDDSAGYDGNYERQEDERREQERQEYEYQNSGYSSQDSYSRDSGESHENYHTNQNPREESQYQKALRYFDLREDFTEDELKKKYREAIKKSHPDSGGDAEEAVKINTYYEELKKSRS